MPENSLRPASDISVDLRARAVEHVERARRDYPELRDVDPEVFVGIVVAWLQPLPSDRLWLSRRWASRRDECVWVGGVIGLHQSVVREAA